MNLGALQCGTGTDKLKFHDIKGKRTMKNVNQDSDGLPSFQFIEQIIDRLERRRLLKGVADVAETHFFSGNEFQLESQIDIQCTGNVPVVFVCGNAHHQVCNPPVVFHPCNSGPGGNGFACGNNNTCQQHSVATQSFDCAHFNCGTSGTNFSCNVQSLFQCNSTVRYLCQGVFACTSIDVGFVCPRNHECSNGSGSNLFECRTDSSQNRGGKFECGNTGADLDSFSCANTSDASQKGFQCSSTRDSFNCENTTNFQCSGSSHNQSVDEGFRCVASPGQGQNGFICKEHFNCHPANKVSCEGGGGTTNNFSCGTANSSFSRCVSNNDKECAPSTNYKCFQNHTCKSPANGGNFICPAYSVTPPQE